MLSEYFDKLGTCNFSEAFDEIFEQISYSTPTQEEQVTLRKLLEINADIRDKEFINDLSLIFSTRSLVPIIREASRCKQFKNSFDIVNAFRILKNLYDSLEDKEDTRNIKDFIFYLLFEPIAQLREHVAKLKSLGFQPLKDTLKSLLTTIDFKLFNGETPCPLSYICSVSTNIHELFRPEYKEAEFVKYLPDIDSIGRDYFELMIESAYTSVNEITIQQGSGSMFDKGRNERNIDIINKLSPHWSHIMTTSATASSFKKQLKNIQNDIAVNVNDGLDIFLGDYEKINNINVGSKINNEAYNASKSSLILYKDKFDSLNKEQQDKVVTFLAKYRPIFNKICVDTVGDIFRNIERAYVAFGNKSDLDTFRNNMFNVLNKQLNDNDISNDLSSSMVSLFNSYARSIRNNRDMLITDKVSWCCSFYAPIVNRLSEKISSNKNLYVKYKQYYEKSPSMSMFPIMSDRSINQTIIGGAKQPIKEKVVYVNNSEPIIKEKIVYVNGGDKDKNDTTTQYIKSIVDSQTEFNKSFEEIYRDLIKSVLIIDPTSKASTQSATLNNCVYALRSIEIDSPKTSYKISGFYPAKNWNKHYISACYKVVQILEKEGRGIFDETIAIVKRLIELCENSAKKAQDILSTYMTTSRTSSEVFYNIKHVGKIECRLSKEELNRYAENLRKLESSLLLITNETSLYSLDQQMKKYANDVQSRADLIREYFKNKSTQLRLNGSYAFNADRVEMLDQFNTQVKNCMLYINDKLDIKLATIRSKKDINVDNKMFDKFEKAMIMFKDVSNNQQLLKILERLHIVLFGEDFENKINRDRRNKLSLELIQIIQKFWKESGYIDFIVQLYTEFNIFDDGFNWSEFRDNISLLLALVNITVSTKYNLECSLLDDSNKEIAVYQHPKEDTIVEILDLESLQNIASKISDLEFKSTTDDTVYKFANISTVQNAIITALQQMLNFANSSNEITGKTTSIPYNKSTKLDTDIYGTMRIRLHGKRYSMSLVDKSKQTNSGEIQIAMLIFDAMLANVLDVVNKYTTIKYTGNFRLPLQISNLIRGGDNSQISTNFNVTDENGQIYGGNVFDILSVNDNNFDTVIIDAVPFYISAFNIIIFYYKKYGADIKNIDETNSDAINTSRLFFEVPKISPIYPLVSKLQAYKVDSLRKLNAQMIKCGIGIFNGYWRKAEGSTAAEKLSASLDMLLNEVNACMVYSSKLQFDALKVTGTLPNNFLQNLSSNINNLTDALKKSISESIIDLSMGRSQQTELYESMMKTALERVKSKGNSEEEKLAELINIIVKTDESHDSLNEVYKFIDLAVMPLFIALTGYNNIFSIYNIVINLEDASKDTDEIGVLDLTKYVLNIKCSTGLKQITVWDCIQELNRLWTNERSIEKAIDFAAYKSALETSSIVTLWNSFVMFNNLYDIVNKGASYKVSNGFWFPSLPKTYPTNHIIRRIGDYSAISNNIKLILYQLYPYISGRNLYDYFISTCGDFASDVDHCLHLLLSYPNVNDKFIASVSNNVHKLIDDKQTLDERFNITQETIKVMQEIDMSGELGYIRPPPYKNNYYIPQYTEDNKVLQSMTVLNSGESMASYTGSGVVPKFINVDGYAQNIVIQRFNQNVNLSADYSWTDWVIQRLADCDITFGCIPSKLIMKLQEYDPTRKKLRTLIYDTNPNVVQTFDMRNMTAYINPITSNIVTRSLSKSNVEKTKENGSISQQWISNLVGLIPYMINKIKAYYSHISGNVVCYDVNVKAELNALNASLVSFYNDIITFVPRIGFMENTNIFNNNKEYHAIAEIVPYLKTKNIENIASSELAKYSWANKYFFGSLSDLIFPEYKEYDRFEKIKEFGKNVFANSIFSNEFNTVIGILAKAMIASSIILGEQQTLNSSPIYMYYDTILKAINGSSELIIPIHEKFVNNVLKVLRNDIINEDNGGFVSALQGGNRIIGGDKAYITNLCKIIIPLLYTAIYGFIDIDRLIVLDNINDRNPIIKNIYDIAHFINILESAELNEQVFLNNFENIAIRFKNIFAVKSAADLDIVNVAGITNIMTLIKQLLIKAYASDTYRESDAAKVISLVNERLTGNNMMFDEENITLAKTNAEKILNNHKILTGAINSNTIITEYGGLIGVADLLATVEKRRGIPLPILVEESSSPYNISDNKINIVYRTLISGLLRFDNEFISINREFRNKPSLTDAITKISQYLNSIPSYKIKARFNNIEAINVMSGSTRRSAVEENRTKDKLVFDIYHYLQNPADISDDQQDRLFDKLYVYKSAKPLNTRLLYNTTNYLSINNYNFEKNEVPILNLLINSIYTPIDDYISAYYTEGVIEESGKLTISGLVTNGNKEQRYKFIIGLLILFIYLSTRDNTIEEHKYKAFLTKETTGAKDFTIKDFAFTTSMANRIPSSLPEAIISWGKYIYNCVKNVSIINDKTYPLLVANAIYCALLNQSIDHVKIEYIIKSTIETNNNFILLHETLKRIIGVIFVKSYLYSTETVFKSVVTSTTRKNNASNNILNTNDIGMYDINTGKIDRNSMNNIYAYNPTEIYTNIRNYVNEGITGYNNQPLLTYTQINLLFLDTSSITGIYNMLNPISNILTTSSLLLNNINTDTMFYRGGFNKLIYAKRDNKNYLLNSSENGLSRLLQFETGANDPFNNIIDTNSFLNNNTKENNNDTLFIYEPLLTDTTKFIDTMNPQTFINSISEGKTYYNTHDFIHTCFTADNAEPTNFVINDYKKYLKDIKIYTISTNGDSYNTFKLINNNCSFADNEESTNPIILSKLILPLGVEKKKQPKITGGVCPYEIHSIKAITPKIKEDNLIESSAVVSGLFKDNNPVRIGLKIIESINDSLTNTTKTYKNTGFASNVLQGGSITEIRFNLLDNVLKSDSEILGAITPTETYKNIYKLDQYTKNTLVSNLYTALFKYGTFDTLNVDGMFALIINYFHKYSVSFNSIYNQVIFPSILYNAAVYGTLAEHYSEVLKLHKEGEHTNAFTTFIQKYFNEIESLKNKQQSFFTKYFETIETGSANTGRTQTSYKDMVNVFNENKENCYKLANMPSINNNLLKLLYKYNFVKYKNDKKETKDIVDGFCGSSLISTLKRIDAVETFSFVILLLSKYMSYYNIDTSEDVPYSGTVGPNPFGFDSII